MLRWWYTTMEGTPMHLRHYSNQPVTLDRTRTYSQADVLDVGPYAKPHGLWVSDESEYGWLQWCNDEDYGPDRLRHGHNVTLATDARVLIINTADRMRAFHERFATQPLPDSDLFQDPTTWAIDWGEVASLVQGVIITPYHWEFRMRYCWYYGWDCASGCIWDLDAIESLAIGPRPTMKALD